MVIKAPKTRPKTTDRKSPVSRIGKISSLKKFPDRELALDLLHQVARAVAPIIYDHRFDVGLLCEMEPKNPNLLGLNVNKGQKILIRLRPAHNTRTFYPMADLIGTFLHELCHNIHGPHNDNFYQLLDELKGKYENGNFPLSEYVCEENRLGSAYVPPWAVPLTIREKRLKALSVGGYKSEVRRLGGKAPTVDIRTALFLAAERRLRDSWCSGSVGEDEEVEILGEGDFTNVKRQKQSSEILGESLTTLEGPTTLQSLKIEKNLTTMTILTTLNSLDDLDLKTPKTLVTKSSYQEYLEVIDLTKENDTDDEIEIFEICAFETSRIDPTKLWASALQNGSQLLATPISPQNPIQYYIPSPRKSFIGDEFNYPRRKLVADLQFQEIFDTEINQPPQKQLSLDMATKKRQSPKPLKLLDSLKDGDSVMPKTLNDLRQNDLRQNLRQNDPTQNNLNDPKTIAKDGQTPKTRKKRPKSSKSPDPPREHKVVRTVSFEELLKLDS